MPIAILRDAARAHPDRPAVVAGGRTVTYAQLVARSDALAARLRARGIDRCAIAVADRIDAIALLAAASAAGVEACVYPATLDAADIAAHADRFAHDTVVVDDDPTAARGPQAPDPAVLVATEGAGRRGPAGPGATEGAGPRRPDTGVGDRPILLPLADLETGSTDAATVGGVGAGTADAAHAPLLVLTTGTTGAPKGVRHDWSRLAAGVHGTPVADGDRWLLAYNLNQFGGLQVLLHALAHHGTVVVPRSSHAADVLDALRRERVTHLSGTPTFWRIVVGGLAPGDVDGLELRQITLGGEPVPDRLLERIAGLFPTARITHVYAATEAGTVVAVSDGRAGLPTTVLDRDEDASVRLRVADGELHVRTPITVAPGDGPDDGWLATGDLVEERDGRLRFVGRTVEIINVGGAKVHPLPIEERILAVDGVDAAAVHGSPNPVTGQIVAVDVVTAPGAEEDAVRTAIQRACADLPAPGRPRRIRFVDELRIRGDKVVRNPNGESS
ncbi:MAG: acyl--CoA ligase [Solirubrobacteraceae bacterium]|nr:acyl--CoA ligase [Solirubrobacteraceae bacterium]